MDVVWDGVSMIETLTEAAAATRLRLADAAKSGDWASVLELVSQDRNLVNVTRPGGRSWYAPLHQAAYGRAPIEVVQRLLELGAWRTLRNARGELAVDVALRRGHQQLLEILEPQHRHRVPNDVLGRIQTNFHAIICGRVDREVRAHTLRLPELEPLLELERPQMWFPVPGMYGGFSYRLECGGVATRLIVESWCRVVDGSGQRHEITAEESRLVEEGFV